MQQSILYLFQLLQLTIQQAVDFRQFGNANVLVIGHLLPDAFAGGAVGCPAGLLHRRHQCPGFG